MMISPTYYYETQLKGKTIAQLLEQIDELHEDIQQLKNQVEENYVNGKASDFVIATRIACLRDYVAEAIKALENQGHPYRPTKLEIRERAFNEMLPSLESIEITIGGLFEDCKQARAAITDDKAVITYRRSLCEEEETFEMNKNGFLDEIIAAHVGEWDEEYRPERFGIAVCDGISWNIEFEFRDGYGPICFSGSNAYPYNFDRLLALMGIDD